MIEPAIALTAAGLACRPVSASDLELICQQREAMFLEAGKDAQALRLMTEHFRPWLAPRLRDGRYYGFIALAGAEPVAGIGLMNLEWPPHPSHPTMGERGYVLNVYVNPSHRRRGLAAGLVQLAEAEFTRRGLQFAVLHATAAGQPVYAQAGWAGTSEMAKRLDAGAIPR